MNSSDRFFMALEKKQPDRVPIAEMIIDPKIIKQQGLDTYFDLIDYMDLDAVMVNGASYTKDYKTPTQPVVNSWGVTQIWTNEVVPITIDHPIKEIGMIDNYIMPDPRVDFPKKNVETTVKRFKGKRAIIASVRAVFGNSWNLRGMENFLMDMVINPSLVKRIVKMVTEYSLELTSLFIKSGVDIILLGDDYAYNRAPLMSPVLFHKYIYPGLKQVVENVKHEGAYCIKHTDGNIWSILDDIVDTGVDCVGPLEPAASMDLGKVKQKYGKSVAVMGNVDVDLLSRGTIEEVNISVVDLIKRVAPNGGFILSSGNSITSSVKLENFIAMVNTARKIGVYR